jgi:ankyrin repeat protein
VWVDPKVQAEDTILIKALKQRDMKLLRELVQDPRMVNEKNTENQTALHIAASLDFRAGARLLLKNRAKPEARDASDCTALVQAILAQHEEFVSMMLNEGVNPNSVERSGTTPLHLACRTGSVKIADLLLTKIFTVDRPDDIGQTALLLCCRLEEFSIARNLLRRGADPNGKLFDGKETFLGFLSSENNPKPVKFLLENGAQVEQQDNCGRTALFRAATNGHSEVCRTLIAYGARPNTACHDRLQTALGSAAAEGKENTVLALLELGADIEGTDSWMRTPLFRAAATGKIQVCELLLENYAEPNPKMAYSDWVMPVLHVACFKGHAVVVELLEAYGADPEALDEYGCTALFVAAEYGKLDVCQSLIRLSANIEAKANGHSVLSIAARYGHLDVARQLIDAGASAMPPASVPGQKWKNFVFEPTVPWDVQSQILELLRANKHR